MECLKGTQLSYGRDLIVGGPGQAMPPESFLFHINMPCTVVHKIIELVHI